MTLRQKTLWITSIALVGLLVLLLSISSTILLKGFIELEEQAVEENVTRLVNALAEQFNNLLTEAEDYAVWDDTYAYMETRDEDYIKSNLIKETFEALNLSCLVILDTHGDLVFGKSYDSKQDQLTPISNDFLEHLREKSLFTQNINESGKFFGFLLFPKQIKLIASYPILASNDEGPSRGTLIMGRNLDDAQIERLTQLTHLSVTVQRLDNPNLPPDFAKAYLALSNQQQVVQILDGKHIAGYILTKDIYQQPAALLRVAMPRKIYQQGLTSLYALSGLVLIFAVVCVSVILWLFERLVLARLATLSHEVMQINVTDNLSIVMVEGGDELAHLATAINNMLKALHASNEQVRHSEASLAEAQRIAHLGNWEWDIINNRLNCSDEIYRIFGLKSQSITPTAELFLNYVHPDDQHKVSLALQKIANEDQPCNLEHRIVQQNGEIHFIHTQGEIIKDNTGKIVRIIGTLQDISELKQAQAETLRLLEENRFLIHRSMAIKEEELKRLAYELHDEFGQCITAIQADAETIVDLAARKQQQPIILNKINLSANAILEVSSHAYDVVHSLMQQLRPSGLDELGLVEALRDLVSTWQARHKKTRCIFRATGELHHLGETINIQVYRVVQECLTNIAKYAQASHVSIKLTVDSVKKILILCVQDNGQGMNLTQYKRGLGLIGMRERATALEGNLQLESALGDGVQITLIIPIAESHLQKHRKWEHRTEMGKKNEYSSVVS
ncbi:sensory transduction histidine kinase [Beggiatoa sp. PS]|nr:sensory transduction histidine kinase [Beggiatoa sp. PS]